MLRGIVSGLVFVMIGVGVGYAQQQAPPPTACQVQLNVVNQGRNFAEFQLGELAVQLQAANAEITRLRTEVTKLKPPPTLAPPEGGKK